MVTLSGAGGIAADGADARSPAGIEAGRRLRVLFVTNIPSPYQVDFFRHLRQRDELDFEVFFCTGTEHDRAFSVPPGFPFEARILGGRRRRGMPKDWSHVPNLVSTLQALKRPDLAVVGGSYLMPVARTVRWWLTKNGVPWVYWGEWPWKKQRGGAARELKRLYLRWFLKPAAGAIGVGSQARDAYRALLPGGRAVSNLPYAPDLEALLHPDDETKAASAKLRSAWGGPDVTVIMFSGSLSERKAPDLLLKGFHDCLSSFPQLRLLFVGDGPMRGALEQEAERLGVADGVRFLGFLEGKALHAAYLSSDILVLPTRTHEGWGVVVQEALAAGLPVILSDRVASRFDLLDHAHAGAVFDPERERALGEAIGKMVRERAFFTTSAMEARRQAVVRWSAGPIAKAFADFAYSLTGQALIKRQGQLGRAEAVSPSANDRI